MSVSRMVSNSTLIALLLATLGSFGCSDLPDLALDTCGNYVIDTGEDCDLHAEEGYTCAGAGEPNACHYICNAPTFACPVGYGCGLDEVCRRATGTFVEVAEVEGYDWPSTIQVGDFDSDGNGDLLLLGAVDSFGYRPSRVLFSQGFSLQSGLTVLPTELANPTVGAGAGAGPLRDIAFADFEGVALLRGYGNRTADFTVFPTISLLKGTHARMILSDVLASNPGDEIIALVTDGDGKKELRGIEFGKPFAKLASMPGGEEELTPRRGYLADRFDETSPCSLVAVAYRDATSVQLFSPCTIAGTWNVGGPTKSITLQPPAKLDQGLISTDIDVDGHLDLLIGAAGRTYVAYGLGDGQFTSQKQNGIIGEAAPYVLPLAAGGAQEFPLAIADLNADMLPDFVMPAGVVISFVSGYDFAYQNFGAPWSEALVGNLNANDFPDVVTIVDGALDLHFLNNAGGGIFAPATLPTEGVPHNLNIGDFDGDLLNDLVFSEAISEHGKLSDHLSFSFGSPFGPPAFPVATGEVGELGQIVTGHVQGQAGPDPMVEIGVIVEGENGQPDSIALLPGRASRAIFSTLPLRNGPVVQLPISLAFGHFGDETADIAALAASTDDGRLSLFRIEAFEEEGLVVPNASDPLPPNFIPSELSKSFNLRHGATVVAADFDGDEIDEALVVGSFADPGQAAFAMAKYDPESSRFGVVDAQVFPAQFTMDSKIVVDDVDGDGTKDIVLTTGSSTAPGDLLIVWGNGTNQLPDLNQQMEHVRLEGDGVRAVVLLQAPNRKGKMLVASNSTALYLLDLTAEHSWTKTKIPDMGSARAFGAVDFDRDGVEDLAVQLDGGLELVRSISR